MSLIGKTFIIVPDRTIKVKTMGNTRILTPSECAQQHYTFTVKPYYYTCSIDKVFVDNTFEDNIDTSSNISFG
jgi:hypothetical protein